MFTSQRTSSVTLITPTWSNGRSRRIEATAPSSASSIFVFDQPAIADMLPERSRMMRIDAADSISCSTGSIFTGRIFSSGVSP